jgi:hypothetical protein
MHIHMHALGYAISLHLTDDALPLSLAVSLFSLSLSFSLSLMFTFFADKTVCARFFFVRRFVSAY